MKVLMQNCVTRRFLGKGDVWYESPNKARDFETSGRAIAYYLSRQLKDAQIVLHFDRTPRYDIELPLSGACEDNGHKAR